MQPAALSHAPPTPQNTHTHETDEAEHRALQKQCPKRKCSSSTPCNSVTGTLGDSPWKSQSPKGDLGVRGQGKRTKGGFCLKALFQGDHDKRMEEVSFRRIQEVWDLCPLPPGWGQGAGRGCRLRRGSPTAASLGPLSFCVCKTGGKCLSLCRGRS